MAGGRINSEKNVDGIRILKIEGHFTKDTIPALQSICYEIGRSQDTRGILLDLKEVSDIDTSAFACIINFMKDQLSCGINVGVVNLKRQEKMLAEILKIDRAIKSFVTEKEAIAALSTK